MSRRRSFSAEHRLATYGTLAPGRANHHEISAIDGQWRTGAVRGHLEEGGWGAAMGFPGLVLDSAGAEIDVYLFEAEDLPAHWARLDRFEGPGYKRELVTVTVDGEPLLAYIYALAERPS